MSKLLGSVINSLQEAISYEEFCIGSDEGRGVKGFINYPFEL
jgi:hypothetical protein